MFHVTPQSSVIPVLHILSKTPAPAECTARAERDRTNSGSHTRKRAVSVRDSPAEPAAPLFPDTYLLRTRLENPSPSDCLLENDPYFFLRFASATSWHVGCLAAVHCQGSRSRLIDADLRGTTLQMPFHPYFVRHPWTRAQAPAVIRAQGPSAHFPRDSSWRGRSRRSRAMTKRCGSTAIIFPPGLHLY